MYSPFNIIDDKLDDSIYEYFTQVVHYCNDLIDYLDLLTQINY